MNVVAVWFGWILFAWDAPAVVNRTILSGVSTESNSRLQVAGGYDMKLSKTNIDSMAKALTNKLLACPGLKDAKRIVNQVKKNLAIEYKRRKNL